MATPTEILTAGGLVNADLIVQAATATGVPLAIAAAMIQKESGGRNVYGHDAGGVYSTLTGPVVVSGIVYETGADIPVTAFSFVEFLRLVTAGAKSNGVGPAQITYSGYFKQAPDYPFWDPLANIRFGLTIIADYLDDDFSDSSISSAGAHYNGGTNPDSKAIAYGADLLAKTNMWRAKLARASEIPEAPMAYNYITSYDSPNHGGYGRGLTLPARIATIHWWGNPSNQDPYGIINHLCDPSPGGNPARAVSAHEVVWPGNVACLVNYDQPSWANGSIEGNMTSLTFECDPNHIPETALTLVQRLADHVRAGNLVEDFQLVGHRDWIATDCPGPSKEYPADGYYPRLAAIRQAVRDNLAGITTPSEDNMPSAEDVARAVWEQPVDVGREDGTTQTEKAGLWAGWGNIHALTAAQRAEQILANQAAQNAKIDALTARLNSISSVTETPAPAPALTPDQLAAAQAALDALASVFNGLAGK